VLRQPEQVSFVPLREVLQVVEGFVLDLRRNNQRSGLKPLRFSGVSGSPVPFQLLIPFQKIRRARKS
jgi:hypothetical protein